MRLGVVSLLFFFMLCGYGSLNLTLDSVWPMNNGRLDSRVKLSSVGICFCLLNNHWRTMSRSRNQKRRNEMGFGIIPSTDTHLKVCHLYLHCPGYPVPCLSCGTIVALAVVAYLNHRRMLGCYCCQGDLRPSDMCTVFHLVALTEIIIKHTIKASISRKGFPPTCVANPPDLNIKDLF